MANTWPPAGQHFADIGDAVLDAAVARRHQRVVVYLDRIELHVMGCGVERVLDSSPETAPHNAAWAPSSCWLPLI